MMSQTRSTRGRENSAQPHLVFTNDDLLTEILIRLPILCIHLFTTVSKQWLQILTSPHFTDRRRKIPILDPPAGIFANHLTSLFECDFVSLDSRLNSKNPLGSLLCSGVFRLAFDPKKSSHYRVVQAGGKAGETWIQIYSLETRIEGLNRELKHCKLNMEDHDHPMTSLEIAHGLHRGRNFLESFGGPINDPILLLMEIPHMLHLEGKFFESCGCLLLVCRDDIGSTKFTIYEMMKGSFVCDDDDDDDAVLFIPPFEVDPNLYEFIPSLASV
ncbi:ferric reduction oxidase 7, chloroplastic-like protein [Tanacetum coccineum]